MRHLEATEQGVFRHVRVTKRAFYIGGMSMPNLFDGNHLMLFCERSNLLFK